MKKTWFVEDSTENLLEMDLSRNIWRSPNRIRTDHERCAAFMFK